MDRKEMDYPQGDGLPNCKLCNGRGVVLVPKEELPAHALPGTTRYCRCVYRRDLLDNLRYAWPPLVKEGCTSTKGSPLVSKTQENMWIRCEHKDLAGHIRAAAVKKSARWRFKVISDADLMTTWLYSANEVYDADVGQSRSQGRNTVSRIPDLVEPYDLIILRMGMKAARNVAMPEVFLEALLCRQTYGLPTWVVDSPHEPLRQSHISWDEKVQQHLSENFTFLDLSATPVFAPATIYRNPVSIETDNSVVDLDGLLDDNGRVRTRRKNWRDA